MATRKQREHERREREQRRAKADHLLIKAALERHLDDLRRYQRLRRLGLAVREPDPPVDRPRYKAAVRRELNRAPRTWRPSRGRHA